MNLELLKTAVASTALLFAILAGGIIVNLPA